jgi:hypothetical protein
MRVLRFFVPRGNIRRFNQQTTGLTEGESTMSVWTTLWRRSLAATAVIACLLLPNGGTGAFADGAEEAERREREAIEHRERDERAEHREREEREQAEHRERDEGHRPLERQRAELLERSEIIEREIHGLSDDQKDVARELRGELDEIRQKIRQIDRELGQTKADRGLHDVFRELVELQGREFELKVALLILPEGNEEKTEHARRELEEIGDRIARLKQEDRDLPPEIAREMKHHRLDQLRHAVARLREAGKPEIAEKMEREVHELAEEIERESHEPRDRPRPEGEEQARHAHAMEAIENLHAAGMHDLAEAVAREIDGMRREHPPERPQHQGDVGAVIEEFRGQMHEMRREMDELRRLVQEVRERE